MPRYIGLSLSRCVLDITTGCVNIDDVTVIVAGTNFDPESPEEVQEIIDRYEASAWRNIPGCADTLRKLLAAEKVDQPKRCDREPYHINLGHWIVQFDTDDMSPVYRDAEKQRLKDFRDRVRRAN